MASLDQIRERIFEVQISRNSKTQPFGLSLRGGAAKKQLVYLDSDPLENTAAYKKLRAHDEIIQINEIDITGETKKAVQASLNGQFRVILTVRRQ